MGDELRRNSIISKVSVKVELRNNSKRLLAVQNQK